VPPEPDLHRDYAGERLLVLVALEKCIYGQSGNLFTAMPSCPVLNPRDAAGHHIRKSMDAEKTIAEIELLEQILRLPDKRPLQMADWKAANRKHDETYANDPWFRLWRRGDG
jgi:hypothetical protein